MNPFWIALQFLTILPTPRISNYDAREMGRSVLYYPLVGLIIGLLLWAAAALLNTFPNTLPYAPLLKAGLLLCLWISLTGALHLDGLADSADAWMGGLGDREKTLVILKDPTSGPIAVTVLIMILLLKFLCLSMLISQSQIAALIVIPALSRSGLLLFFIALPYVRKEGIASTMMQTVSKSWAIGITATIAIALLLIQWQAITALVALAALFLVMKQNLLKRLGGFTGDTLGAWVELAELTLLLWAALGLL